VAAQLPGLALLVVRQKRVGEQGRFAPQALERHPPRLRGRVTDAVGVLNGRRGGPRRAIVFFLAGALPMLIGRPSCLKRDGRRRHRVMAIRTRDWRVPACREGSTIGPRDGLDDRSAPKIDPERSSDHSVIAFRI